MKLHSFAVALLLLGAPSLAVQTKPRPQAQQKAALVADNTPEARVERYFSDLTQRLREIYYAPSDGRAITLLTTSTQEFGARRKGLQAELRHPGKLQTVAGKQTQWQKTIDELNASAPAKFADRCQRNPALETAYLRFVGARLQNLLPPAN